MAAVDILMATYNGDRFVREQVESVQAQTFEDWRLLVSDDCSSDGTLGVVRGMVGADSRIQIVSEGVRFGSAKANFMGLLACSDAPYAMFCDQDDVWLPRKVGRTLGAMRELESAYGAGRPLLVFTDMKVVDEDLEPIAESFERYQGLDPARLEFRQVLAQAVGAGCTFLMNRSLVKLAQRCGDVDRMVMHDWWVAAVAAAFGRIGYLDEPTSLYRQHADNSVGARRYSALGWAGRLGDMVESQRRVSAQAGFLVLTYGPLMDETRLRCARSCASVCEGGAFAGLASLVRSGAWKAGSRKFGQIAAALAGGGVDRGGRSDV